MTRLYFGTALWITLTACSVTTVPTVADYDAFVSSDTSPTSTDDAAVMATGDAVSAPPVVTGDASVTVSMDAERSPTNPPPVDMMPPEDSSVSDAATQMVDAADMGGMLDGGSDAQQLEPDASPLDSGVAQACIGPVPRLNVPPPERAAEDVCMNCVGAPMPTWRLADFQPLSCGFEETYGMDSFVGAHEGARATLVALFNAGCGYCRRQAENLELMRLELGLAGLDAHFVAVNGSIYAAHQEGLAERCSFPLLQDTDETSGITEMDGAIYDIYVYGPGGTLHVYLSGFDELDTNLSNEAGYANVRAAVVAANSGAQYEAPFPPVDIIEEDAGIPAGGD